jgi:hypothetical protein
MLLDRYELNTLGHLRVFPIFQEGLSDLTEFGKDDPER